MAERMSEFVPKKDSIEREPRDISARYYFFRHDTPLYGKEMAAVMEGFGFPTNLYSSARFGEQKIPTFNEPYHPTTEQLAKFAKRGRSEVFPGEGHRSIYEAVTVPPEERKTFSRLLDVLKREDTTPFIFTGPRTRHGTTAEAVANDLKQSGIEFDEKNVAVTDMLTDINKHWVYLYQVSRELKLDIPWESFENPELRTEHREAAARLGLGNIENTEDATARIKHYLVVLERLFKKRVAHEKDFSAKTPAAINFTSDFTLIAVLRAVGIKEVSGIPVTRFKPEIGSYIGVEVNTDNTADVYYHSPSEQQARHITRVSGYREKIRS